MDPWAMMVNIAELSIGLRWLRAKHCTLETYRGLRHNRRTTADNRALTKLLDAEGLLCSGDCGGPLLDGTRLPTF